ncbi:unnamed protein product, partial [Urochloa humidicola]
GGASERTGGEGREGRSPVAPDDDDDRRCGGPPPPIDAVAWRLHLRSRARAQAAVRRRW